MLKFSYPLHKGTLVKRYKRFFADVLLEDGTTVTSHCANTGSMKTCGSPGETVYLLHNPSPKKKLAYSWEFTKTGKGFIGVNTSRPNAVVHEAIKTGHIKEFRQYDTIKREAAFGEHSRIDFLLEDSTQEAPACYVEVKNVTLKGEGCVMFPDAVTERGLKHLNDLIALKRSGYRSVMFYFINRPDGDYFRIASEIDKKYAEGLHQALAAGVEVLAYRAQSSLTGISVGDAVAVKI